MKARAGHRREDLFVLRMWTEADDASGHSWRASITHAASGERRYFTNYGNLCEFLDRWRAGHSFSRSAD